MPEEQRSKLFDAAAGAGAGSFPPPYLHPTPSIFAFAVVAAAGFCLVSVVCARTHSTQTSRMPVCSRVFRVPERQLWTREKNAWFVSWF
jgi:hypothetical protein